ncbi:hypothetical protein [Streptomyces sp. Wh19]|nr:hypothetical protein [Streptomyces sp. Wh19]MDV9197029.1 hypothetical protein [Streptomyces sp. Wh19]
MEDRQDLDELLARVRQKTARDLFAEMEAAGRADEAAPWPEPSVIPMPSYPRRGTLRFSCPLGCGWHHDEDPGREAATERLVVPLDPDLVSEALTAEANARAQAFKTRVEAAITDHFAEAYPGRCPGQGRCPCPSLRWLCPFPYGCWLLAIDWT